MASLIPPLDRKSDRSKATLRTLAHSGLGCRSPRRTAGSMNWPVSVVRRHLSGAVFFVVLFGGEERKAFGVRAWRMHAFAEGDIPRVTVNKLTSTKTLLGLDYYRLPFCQPWVGPRMDNQNFGEFLAGDRIESTPYRIKMKEDMYCEQVCITNLGRSESKGVHPNKVGKAIKENYHINWILDDLPAASKIENDMAVTTRYVGGVPIGFVAAYTQKAYIFNHINFEIQYHAKDGEADRYNIVRFVVQPFSVKHEFELWVYDDDAMEEQDNDSFRVARITNPIVSCGNQSKWSTKRHTSYDMVYSRGREPQLASGKVLFTYDVIWIENEDQDWASRWDIYLTMDNAIPGKVHWLDIARSAVLLLLLFASVVVIAIRDLRRTAGLYDQVATEEAACSIKEGNGVNEQGSDEILPQASSSLMALAVMCGTGAQLLIASLITIGLCVMGVLSHMERGSLVMGPLLVFVLCGCVGGYVTARQHKAFHGKRENLATLLSSFLFPGMAFGFYLVFDFFALLQGSSHAVPVVTLVLLVILLLVNATLVFLGCRVGYKQSAFEVNVEKPTSPLLLLTRSKRCIRILITVTAILTGILSFGALFMEFYFVLGSIFFGSYYSTYGVLLIAFIIATMTCASGATLCTYLLLRSKNARGQQIWWYPFLIGGSVGGWLFLHSFIYFGNLEIDSFGAGMAYIGFMSFVSLGLFLMMGCVGMMSSQLFLLKMVGMTPPERKQHHAPLTPAVLPLGYIPPSLEEPLMESSD